VHPTTTFAWIFNFFHLNQTTSNILPFQIEFKLNPKFLPKIGSAKTETETKINVGVLFGGKVRVFFRLAIKKQNQVSVCGPVFKFINNERLKENIGFSTTSKK
jgi:hypothetical protein